MRAKAVAQATNDNTTWYSEAEYLEAVCAVVTLLHHELQRPTARGISLHKLLSNSVAPDRVQWLMNNIRLRRRAPEHMLPLLGSGLTPSHSLNHNESEMQVPSAK